MTIPLYLAKQSDGRAFAKLKALLRRAAERTVEGLWTAIGRILETFAPQECRNYFAGKEYDPNRWDSALAPLR